MNDVPYAVPLLSLVLSTPLAGAVVLGLVPGRQVRAIRWIANLFALAGLLASLPLWFHYDVGNPAWQFVERVPWIPSIGAEYHLGVDGFGALMVLLTTLVGAIVALWSWSAVTERVKEYYVFFLLLEASMVGAFVSLDFLLFFVFWEAMLIPAYFLVGIWGGERRLYSALKFLLYTLAGSVVTLLGILALYFWAAGQVGRQTFDVAVYHQLAVPAGLQWWVFLAFFFGFAIRVPLFPLHTWLPDAHTEAPAAVSVLLAGLLLKTGTYGFIRFSLPILPAASRSFVPAMVTLSIVGIVYGALVATGQRDWKRVVAYSSISQMGLVMLGMFALDPAGLEGSMLQQISHAISTGALFLLAGAVCGRRRTRQISDFGGLAKVMPVCATIFGVMVLASIGLPVFSGFIGELLILQGVLAVSKAWAALAAAGIVLMAACMLWLYQRTMLGRVENPANEHLADLRPREICALVPLVVLALWIGVYPAPVMARLDSSVGHVIARLDVHAADQGAPAKGDDCTQRTPATSPWQTPACGQDEPVPSGTGSSAEPEGSPPAQPAAVPDTAARPGAQPVPRKEPSGGR